MSTEGQTPHIPHVIWVYEGSLGKLDAATWLETSRELSNLGWRVTLVAAGPKGVQRAGGVPVTCVAKPGVYLLGQIIFHLYVVGFILRQWTSTDIILFHSMAAPWILPLGFVRRLVNGTRPLLAMDTRTLPMSPRSKESWKDRFRRVFLDRMEQAANRWADGRLAITSRMACALQIPPEQLWGVWPSGVRLEDFSGAKLERHWPMANEPIHVVYVGVLNYERNLMTLSHAIENLNSRGMKFALSLLGDGTERADLEAFGAQTMGRIQILAPVPQDQVWELLARAHVGVLPFPDEEKFRVSSPIKLFEYMAAGLPILATRIVCHSDVVGSGSYVIWAEQSDLGGLTAALCQIWKNRAHLQAMGAEAANSARAWTWHESAKKLGLSLEHGLKNQG